MPMLGDILAAARREAGAFRTWLEERDPDLMALVAQVAGAGGETPTGFVRAAVADFAQFASEEDWASLTSRMRDSDDPGAACLTGMVQWRLAAARRGAESVPPQGEGVPDERQA